MNLSTKTSKKRSKVSGQSAIEFAFIVPLLLGLILAAFEFSQMFIQSQKVSSLSREAANAVFRDCSSLPNDQLQRCVDGVHGVTGVPDANGVLDDINLGAGKLLAGFNTRGEVLVSIYKWDASASPNVVLAYPAAANPHSHINVNNVDQGLLTSQGVLVVGEILYQYMPSTMVANLLGMPATGKLYEITI